MPHIHYSGKSGIHVPRSLFRRISHKQKWRPPGRRSGWSHSKGRGKHERVRGTWPCSGRCRRNQGGIFVGLLGCGSAVLIGISLGLLCGGAAVPLGRAASLLWIADAAVQLPKLLAPGSPVVGEIPGSWTGLPTLLLQLPGGLAIAGCGALFSQALIPRYACLSVAVSLRCTLGVSWGGWVESGTAMRGVETWGILEWVKTRTHQTLLGAAGCTTKPGSP